MSIIDDEGNLFGVLNIIDFLAVLLVLSVAVAGIALLDPFATAETETRYATVEIGEQPAYITELVNTGDQMSPEGTPRNITVTDVYTTVGTGTNGTVTVAVQINGTTDPSGEQFRYNGEPVRQGDDITLETSEYVASGTITRLTSESRQIETATTTVTAETIVSRSTIDEITVGDEYTVAGTAIGTVESRSVYPASEEDQARIALGLSLQTRIQDGQAYFANSRVTIGRSIPFKSDGYNITPTVQGRGSDLQSQIENRTIKLQLSNVSAETAAAVESGLTERVGGIGTARITAVQTEPAAVILRSESGQIYRRDHPQNKDMVLSVQARVRNTTTGYRFHGRSIQIGSQVTLSFRKLTIRGTVTEI